MNEDEFKDANSKLEERLEMIRMTPAAESDIYKKVSYDMDEISFNHNTLIHEHLTKRKALLEATRIALLQNMDNVNDKTETLHTQEINNAIMIEKLWNELKQLRSYNIDKLNIEYIWEWQNKNNEWIPFSNHRSHKFDAIEVGKEYEFSVAGHIYTFHKTSLLTGYQVDVAQCYKVMDASPEDINTSSPRPLTQSELSELKVQDMIDIQYELYGKFHGARVIKKVKTQLSIHYLTSGNKNDVSFDYERNPHGIEVYPYGSISSRLSQKHPNLQIGDYINVKVASDNWKWCRIINKEKESGQVEFQYCSYAGEYCTGWTHIDGFPLQTKSGRFMTVKRTRNASSAEIMKLLPGTSVTVEEIDGKYCRISKPCDGWVMSNSIESKTNLKTISKVTNVGQMRRREISITDTKNINNWNGVKYPNFWNNNIAFLHDINDDLSATVAFYYYNIYPINIYFGLIVFV